MSAAAWQLQLDWHGRRDILPLEELSLGGLPEDTAVLFYAALPDRVVPVLLLSSGCELLVPRVGAPRPELWARVTEVLHKLRFGNRWSPEQPRPAILSTLAEMLGLPEVLRRLPARVKHLSIIPDSVVAHVPFAALHVEDQPLVERLALSFLPLATWTPSLAHRHGQAREALGVKVARTSLGDYAELSRAEEELEALSGLGPRRLQLLRDGAATRGEVTRALAEAELAHFVCHGEFRREQPHTSGLALAAEWLTVADLRQVRMERMGLVVLDACLGASAAVLPGRETISLPAAFLRQGARSVLAPLWEVTHDASVDFARALYARLRELGPVEALASIQREWIAGGRRPTHWAPYVVFLDGVAPTPLRRAWLRARALLSRRSSPGAPPGSA